MKTCIYNAYLWLLDSLEIKNIFSIFFRYKNKIKLLIPVTIFPKYWTQDLMHTKQVLYHWATPPAHQ